MNDRDTERRPATSAADDDASFLVRWSRRKRAIAVGAPLPEPIVVAPPAPAIDEANEDVPLADPALLDFADDFTPYLKARVAPALKKAALKKLFSDPTFNEIDGLDVYLEDFNKVPDLPAADLALLKHAREVLWPGSTAAEKEKGRENAATAAEPASAPAVAQADESVMPPSPVSEEARATASNDATPDDDALRRNGVDS